MKLNNKKRITIDVEFRSFMDLQRALRRIGHIAREGQQNGVVQMETAKGQWHMEYDLDEKTPTRTEIIDGKVCLILESKINKR